MKQAMGMDMLVRSGVNQTWIGVGRQMQQPRIITAINGNRITLDVPLTDAVNNTYDTGTIVLYSAPLQFPEMGIENIRFERIPDGISELFKPSQNRSD